MAFSERVLSPSTLWLRLEKLLASDKLTLQELALVEPITVGFHGVARAQVEKDHIVGAIGCGAIGPGAIAGAAFRGAKEFEEDLAVIAYVVEKYELPENLKLSVHSGSDKFSIYQPIREALEKTGAGLHIKTAGTTWLEELIGLAEADGEALDLAKEVYVQAFANSEALCEPYASVIDVDPAQLPSPDEVNGWSASQYVNALRHDPNHPEFNSSFRQLLHVGYKAAAKMGQRYLDMLKKYEESVSRNVTGNLYDRHLKPLFVK